jgi:hypothetical protein
LIYNIRNNASKKVFEAADEAQKYIEELRKEKGTWLIDIIIIYQIKVLSKAMRIIEAAITNRSC